MCLERKLLNMVFEPRREVAGGRRKLHSKELVVICNSSHVFKVMKSRRTMRRNKSVARIDKSRSGSKTVVGREDTICRV